MRQAPSTRFAALIALCGLFGGTGCIHNHYYGVAPAQGVGMSVCDPVTGVVTASATPRVGAACDVPGQSNGSMVAQAGGASPLISRAGSPSRVIVSQPTGIPRFNRPFSAWRRQQDPESLAQTHVEGAYDESVNR